MLRYAGMEALRTLRDRRYAIFVVLFPVVLYLINAGIYGHLSAEGGVRQSVHLMVQMAGYGALGAAMMSTAVPWAQERRSGWVRQIQITPLPGWAVVAAKAAAAMLLVLPALVLVFAAAVIQQGVTLPAATWASLASAMWLGAVPFAALGLAIGSLAPPGAAQPAAFVCMFALSVLGGLWFPVEVMGATLRTIAVFTPAHPYAALGTSVVAGGGPPAGALLAVAAWTAVFGALAAYAYRRATSRA